MVNSNNKVSTRTKLRLWMEVNWARIPSILLVTGEERGGRGDRGECEQNTLCAAVFSSMTNVLWRGGSLNAQRHIDND